MIKNLVVEFSRDSPLPRTLAAPPTVRFARYIFLTLVGSYKVKQGGMDAFLPRKKDFAEISER